MDKKLQEPHGKIIHQQNLRSSESNVTSASGISGTDYYLICTKVVNERKKCNTKVINVEKEIYSVLSKRNEETSINVIIDHFINILLNDSNAKLPNNLMEKIKKVKTKDMYYCAESKSFKLNKYDVDKMSLSKKIYNDVKVFIKKNKNIKDIEVFLFEKYQLDLRPELQQIKRIYNEVVL